MAVARRSRGWAAAAFRSGLEEANAAFLRSHGIDPRYEEVAVEYQVPATTSKYTPDFILPNGIVVETKGYFDADDRKKHLLVRTSRPDLDIRFVFTNPQQFCQSADRKAYKIWLSAKHGRKIGNATLFTEWRTTCKTKRALVTYGEWCDHHGFRYAKDVIPLEWLPPRTAAPPADT